MRCRTIRWTLGLAIIATAMMGCPKVDTVEKAAAEAENKLVGAAGSNEM
jgi:hypothetical protein